MSNISKLLLIGFGGLGLCIISACSSCSKGDNCPSRLVYKIPFALYPQKDTFKIGIDTIWIEANFNGMLIDTNGISNTFDGCDFKIELTTEKINTDPTTGNTVENFPSDVKLGEMIPRVLSNLGLSYYEVKPVYLDGQYNFKAGLIPQEKGLFSLSIAPIIFKELDCPLSNNCKKTAYVVYAGMNNGLNNNFEFLQNSPAYIKDTKKVDFDNGGAYIFYVK